MLRLLNAPAVDKTAPTAEQAAAAAPPTAVGQVAATAEQAANLTQSGDRMADQPAWLCSLLCSWDIPEDQAFWWALVCRSFRDAVIDQYPDVISGVRTHTPMSFMVTSVERMEWVKSLPGGTWREWTRESLTRQRLGKTLSFSRERTTVCFYAAVRGDLELLQWARANGCGWDERVTAAAARGGHLAVLQWAVDKCCPRDSETMRAMQK